MVTLIISNDVVQVCTKADKLETTDFANVLTFSNVNPYGKMLLRELKCSTFNVLNSANGNLVIGLPLEGWGCAEITEEEFIINNKRTPLLMLENALNYKNDNITATRTIMVTYCEDNVQSTKICKIKCMRIPNGIAVSITHTCDDESMYYMSNGVMLKKIFRNFSDLTEMYKYLIKSVFYREDKIISIDEVTTTFCEI